MAFARSGLCRIGGSGTGGSTWQYSTADATSAVVADTNYFASAKDELNAGDAMIVIGTTGSTPTGRISYVESNNGTTVVMAAGTVITA
tara:strand:- start:10946 stop:11209 length:264 start_codon:yes stop_codon:yes gene_type:complete